MKNKALNRELCRLTQLLEDECRKYRVRSEAGKSPMEPLQQQTRLKICEWTDLILKQCESVRLGEADAEVLILLMDAYEINPDENRLQIILSLAEKLLPELPDSPLKCKLLSYCYYYVEEAECAKEASRIIAGWDKSCYTPEMTEAVECYFNLVDWV